MKNNKFIKIGLALALATTALGPAIEEGYASEATNTTYDKYLENYNSLKNTIDEAKKVKNTYKYINASPYYRQNVDARLKNAEDALAKAPANTADSNYEVILASSYLKTAINDLNGQKADLGELNKLVEDDTKFVATDAYKNAPAKLKNAYISAIQKARPYYNLSEEGQDKSNIDKLTADLKKAREDIKNSHAPNQAKASLKEEIKKASEFRNKANDYTKASFDSFKSALRLAETAVEDKSNIKTAAEYKEIEDSLRTAREALVEKEVKNEALEGQIKKLEEAVE